MGQIINKEIVVKGISQESTPFGATKTLIRIDGKNGKDVQLYFLNTKKKQPDGTGGGPTKAQQDFDQIKVGIGTALKVGVITEPYSFVANKGDNIGKTVSGTRYRIVNIELDSGPGKN